MKQLRSFCYGILVGAALVSVMLVTAQTKPENVKLNAEASKAWLEIEAAKTDLRKQYQVYESQQVALAIGAGVPQPDREHWINDKGVIVFVHQEAAKASPEKK